MSTLIYRLDSSSAAASSTRAQAMLYRSKVDQIQSRYQCCLSLAELSLSTFQDYKTMYLQCEREVKLLREAPKVTRKISRLISKIQGIQDEMQKDVLARFISGEPGHPYFRTLFYQHAKVATSPRQRNSSLTSLCHQALCLDPFFSGALQDRVGMIFMDHLLHFAFEKPELLKTKSPFRLNKPLVLKLIDSSKKKVSTKEKRELFAQVKKQLENFFYDLDGIGPSSNFLKKMLFDCVHEENLDYYFATLEEHLNYLKLLKVLRFTRGVDYTKSPGSEIAFESLHLEANVIDRPQLEALFKNARLFVEEHHAIFSEVMSITIKYKFDQHDTVRSLTSLPSGIIHHLINLRQLRISGMKLSLVPDDLFSANSLLTVVSLTDSKFEHIPQAVLNLNQLRSLDLYGSSIQSISEAELKKLLNLEILALSRNKNIRVASGALELKKLKKVFLNDLDYKEFNEEMFGKRAKEITYLDLSSNCIEFKKSNFSPFKSIEELYLAKNAKVCVLNKKGLFKRLGFDHLATCIFFYK